MSSFSDTRRRSIKLLSFGYLATIYLAIAFASTLLADRFTEPLDAKAAEGAPLYVHVLYIVAYAWYLTTVAYVARIVVKHIPFPLDGESGFEFSQTRELVGFPLFGTFLIACSTHLTDRIKYVFWRIGGKRGRLSLVDPK